MNIEEIKSKLNSYKTDISSLENECSVKKNELEQLEKSEVNTIEERKEKSKRLNSLKEELEFSKNTLKEIKEEKENFCEEQKKTVQNYLATKWRNKEVNEENVFNEQLKGFIDIKLNEIKAEALRLDEEVKKKHDEFFKEKKEIEDIANRTTINYFDIYKTNVKRASIYLSLNEL